MNWELIRNFGKVKYFNISYVVLIVIPLFANFLLHFNEILNKNFQLSYSVKALYIASVLYASAIAIYQYSCPSIIRLHSDLNDYIEKNIEVFKNKAPDLKYHIVLANLSDAQKKTRDMIIDLNDKVLCAKDEVEKGKYANDLEAKLNSVYHSAVQGNLEQKYHQAKSQKPILIKLTGALYIIATAIVVVILVARTIIVLKS